MKFLNEENIDISERVTSRDDVVKLYFRDSENNRFSEGELHMKTKEFHSDVSDTSIPSKYIDEKLDLIHAEFKSDQLFNKIEQNANHLNLSHSYQGDYRNVLKELNHFYQTEFKLDDPGHNIKSLNEKMQETRKEILEVNELLQSVNEYRSNYSSYENLLNDSLFDHTYAQDSQIERQFTNLSEVERELTMKERFLELSITNESETYLKNMNQELFKSISLDPDNFNVQELIAKTHPLNLTVADLLPEAVSSHENALNERILDKIESVRVGQYIDHSLQRLSMYDSEVDYEKGNLKKSIEKNQTTNLDMVRQSVSNEFIGRYGKDFLKDEDVSQPKRLFEKILPVVENDTFSPFKAYRSIDSELKQDKEVKDYWKSQSHTMLEEYLIDKGSQSIYKQSLETSSDLSKIENRVNKLIENRHELSDREIKNTKLDIEDTISELNVLKTNITHDLAAIKPHPDKELNKDEQVAYNRLINNFSYTANVSNDLEKLNGYISMVEAERETEQSKDFEQEL